MWLIFAVILAIAAIFDFTITVVYGAEHPWLFGLTALVIGLVWLGYRRGKPERDAKWRAHNERMRKLYEEQARSRERRQQFRESLTRMSPDELKRLRQQIRDAEGDNR